MVTRSLRKAIVFCENNTENDFLTVSVRVLYHGRKYTYYCTPLQALETMLFRCDKFIWFRPEVCA